MHRGAFCCQGLDYRSNSSVGGIHLQAELLLWIRYGKNRCRREAQLELLEGSLLEEVQLKWVMGKGTEGGSHRTVLPEEIGESQEMLQGCWEQAILPLQHFLGLAKQFYLFAGTDLLKLQIMKNEEAPKQFVTQWNNIIICNFLVF